MMFVYADGLLMGAWSWGYETFYMFEATPSLDLRGKFLLPLPAEVPDEKKARGGGFNSPAISGRRLFIRHGGHIFAYDVASR